MVALELSLSKLVNAFAVVDVEPVALAGRELAVLRPRDSEALLDEEAFEREEFLPYWAELWPSGLALARHLASLPLRGRAVLELGCGLALPSLAAALGGVLAGSLYDVSVTALVVVTAALQGLAVVVLAVLADVWLYRTRSRLALRAVGLDETSSRRLGQRTGWVVILAFVACSVMASIAGLAADITIVMIAHRLTTLKDCDRIIHLEGGRIERIVEREEPAARSG